MLVIGLFAVIMMKEVPLRTQSGVDARNAEDTTAAAAAAVEGGPDALPAPRTSNGSAPATVTTAPPAGAGPGSVPGGGNGGVPAERNGEAALQLNGSSGVGVLAGTRAEPAAAPAGADARDRLLAMLLPDPERALSVVTEAERARDAVRRAHSELEERIAELDGATEELVAQGLSRHQVRELLGLTGDEDHGRGAHAAE